MNYYFPGKTELRKRKRFNCCTLILVFLSLAAMVRAYASLQGIIIGPAANLNG